MVNEGRIMWVLGAPDPEMGRIEEILREEGACYQYALEIGPPARLVSPRSAYDTRRLRCPPAMPVVQHDWCGNLNLVLVECAPPVPSAATVVVVDHHHKGDPGYGRPPAEYMEASSLGQVLALLDREPTAEDRLVAAGDHCPGHAYRGRCPGVDPDELLAWRVSTRAAFQSRSEADLTCDVDAAREILRNRANGGLIDLRGRHVPELREAALREGVAYAASLTERDGRRKIVIGGNADNQDEIVAAFLAGEIFPELTDRYGDPARGYAGGYIVSGG